MTGEHTCPLCAHADRAGSWPATHRGTHCRECHRSWTSKREAHCVVCHEHFSSNAAADQHWVAGHHHDVRTLPTRKDGTARLVAGESRFGVVWTQPMDEARLESLRRAHAHGPNSAANAGKVPA